MLKPSLFSAVRLLGWSVATWMLLTSGSFAAAALVQDNFNSLANGSVWSQPGGGVGLNSSWQASDFGSTALNAISGDLTAPTSTNFGLTQSGEGRSLQSASAAYTRRGRTLTAPLDGGGNGEIWFSYLVNLPTATSAVGLALNPIAGSGNNVDVRISANATSLQILDYGASTPIASLADAFTVNETALIVGRFLVSDLVGGSDTLSLWVNPDVGALGAAHLEVSIVDWLTNDQISGIGVFSGNSATGVGGIFDFLTMSNGPNGYFAVTGVPEPSTWGLIVSGGLALAFVGARRRRRAA